MQTAILKQYLINMALVWAHILKSYGNKRDYIYLGAPVTNDTKKTNQGHK